MAAAGQPRFWDNLVPLRASLSGPQLAGWQPGAPAMTDLGCRCIARQRIALDDGAELAADLYLPKPGGRYPVVVCFALSGARGGGRVGPIGGDETPSPPVFTERGYACLVVSRRGNGRSVGDDTMIFGAQDVADHGRAIAWAAVQPWCDGRAVLVGRGFGAMALLQAAATRPPALKGFVCSDVSTDFIRHLVRFGGVPAVAAIGLWLGADFTAKRLRARMPPVVRAALGQVRDGTLAPLWRVRPFRRRGEPSNGSRQTGAPVAQARRWFVDWLVDGKSRSTTSMPPGPSADLDAIRVPFLAIQSLGVFNAHQYGSYELFEKSATPADRKWLVLAPPDPEANGRSWQLEALAFFDHILYAQANGYAAQPPVRYWRDGTDAYAGAAAFPVAGGHKVRLHLRSRGADAAIHALTRNGPESSAANSWVAVPLSTSLIGGFDTAANQSLTYEFVADTDVEFAGAVTMHLKFSCNDIDSQIVARLGRVDGAGRLHLLSMGTVGAARRRRDPLRSNACEIAIDTDTPQPLTPGVPVDLAFSLTPAPTLLRRGERLRLDLASRVDRLRGDMRDGFVHLDLPGPPYLARNTVHDGAASWLELHEVMTDLRPGADRR